MSETWKEHEKLIFGQCNQALTSCDYSLTADYSHQSQGAEHDRARECGCFARRRCDSEGEAQERRRYDIHAAILLVTFMYLFTTRVRAVDLQFVPSISLEVAHEKETL